MSTTFNRDYNLEVRRGNVPGVSVFNVIGHKYALDTTEVVIAELDSTDDIDQSALHATPATVTISSSSANDTSAGSGVRTVHIFGLGSDGLVQFENVTMNGQTAVTTSNTWKNVNGMIALTWGGTTWNEGTIYAGTGTVTSGKPAVIAYSIGFDSARSKGGNKGLGCYYCVPTGRKFYGIALAVTVGTTNKDVQVHIQRSADGINWITEEVFESVGGASIVKDIKDFSAVGDECIRITGIASASGANVSAVLDGYLVVDD